jgi:hypothetical protein
LVTVYTKTVTPLPVVVVTTVLKDLTSIVSTQTYNTTIVQTATLVTFGGDFQHNANSTKVHSGGSIPKCHTNYRLKHNDYGIVHHD